MCSVLVLTGRKLNKGHPIKCAHGKPQGGLITRGGTDAPTYRALHF